MSEITDIVSATAAVISAAATCIAAAGVWYAHRQLHTSRQIAQLQFEDALAKEYRELANRLPTKILLGGEHCLFRYAETQLRWRRDGGQVSSVHGAERV